MAGELKVRLVVFAVLLLSNMQQYYYVNGTPQVPCYFIFGDSLADNGNNNNLRTMAKVNYSPYGIDFPDGPTGRFTNGRTALDIIAELLGFDRRISAAATATGKDILKGVNYASGSAGILDQTGQQLGTHISLNGQLKNHLVTVLGIVKILGSRNATDYLKKCLYSVGMGSNDYLNNYFIPQFYQTSRLYTPDQYASVLISQYSAQIKTLYNFGARKIALMGLGQIGCIPRSLINGSACADNINNAAQLFNARLKSLVDKLNGRLTDAKFIYVNNYAMGSNGNLSALGFKVFNVGCCPVLNNGQCIPSGNPCQNRSEYLFWDSFHPTEAVNKFVAGRSYKAFDPSDTYPIDISRLAQLPL